MESMSAKEKYLICNTLSCIPNLLQGKAVLIDLRNETSVAGRIANADGFMNIHLTEAVFIDRHGLQYEFEEFIVKNRCIRQLQIPESIDIAAKMNAMLGKLGKRREPKPGKRTFKQKRAMMQHANVLDEIAEQNKRK